MSTDLKMSRDEFMLALAAMQPQTVSYSAPDGSYKSLSLGGPAIAAYILRLENALVKLATKMAEQ